MAQIPNQPISGHRLAQSAWFVISVYLGLVISDTTKDGLIPAILGDGIGSSRLWIIVPTLIFYFLNAVEAYLLLNPARHR